MAISQKTKRTPRLNSTCSETLLTETKILYWCNYYNKLVKEIAITTRFHSIQQIAPLPRYQEETSKPMIIRAFNQQVLALICKKQGAHSRARTRTCCNSTFTRCSWCIRSTRPKAKAIAQCALQWSLLTLLPGPKSSLRLISPLVAPKIWIKIQYFLNSQSWKLWPIPIKASKTKMIWWVNWTSSSKLKDSSRIWVHSMIRIIQIDQY